VLGAEAYRGFSVTVRCLEVPADALEKSLATRLFCREHMQELFNGWDPRLSDWLSEQSMVVLRKYLSEVGILKEKIHCSRCTPK
jgi:hypothetical protein